MRIPTAVGVGALVVLCVLRRHDLAAAAGAVPPQALGALAAPLSATSLAGVLAYSLVLALTSRRSGPGGARARAARTRESG